MMMRLSKADEQKIGEEIAKELEAFMFRSMEAINAHQFNPDLDPWTGYAEGFHMNLSTGVRGRVSSKADMLKEFATLTARHKDFKIWISNISVNVYTKHNKAELYLNSASTGGPGVPLGMERSSVSVFFFERTQADGKWWLMREVTLTGMEHG